MKTLWGNEMRNKAINAWGLFLLLLIMFSLPLGFLFSYDRKARVSVDKAPVHLDPTKKSPVVATLDKGTLLTLSSERKYRKYWDYVYFNSGRAGQIKSGYILDDSIERLYQKTKVLTIQGDGVKSENPEEIRNHFRSTRWGMSKEQVVGIEGRPNHLENSKGLDFIQYPQRILNMNCLIGYMFAENKLAKAKYSFLGKRGDKKHYIQEYDKIKEILIKIYGKPVNEWAVWYDPQYKNDHSSWELAVCQGHLELNSKWKDTETEILLHLSGGNNRLSLEVDYSGLEYMDLAKKAQAKSPLDLW
jgi:hypothetical protein